MADGGRGGLRELVARGRSHTLAGEHAEAVACFTEVLREKAPYADVYDMLGFIYHQEGRLAEAEEMFREALRINPSYTEAALNLVVTCNDLGKYAEARTIYERAMAASKRAPRELDPFVKGKLANMHAEMGAAYRAAALYDEAVGEYERALALGPTFADIRTELGKTRREMGDLAGSVRELERVRAESPRFMPGRIHLGLVYYAAGRHDDAAGEWRAVLGAEPENASARMYLAMLNKTNATIARDAAPRPPGSPGPVR
jgi:tetratricopeptide (TPR) repeat protein